MRHKIFIGILFTLLCVMVVPINAQEDTATVFDEHPLFEMLSVVPDNEPSRAGVVYYMDYRAVENAADYIPTYENVDEWINGDGWLGFTQRWSSVPIALSSGFTQEIERIPEVMGFDFFDIDQTLAIGEPPDTTTVWRGEFDADSIVQAHLAREYLETEINGVQVLCGAGGCDNGTQVNIANRDPASLFDPQLGREFPFAIVDNTLITSIGLPSLENAISAHNGELQSLAKAEDFRTLAEAMLNPDVYEGELVQAHVIGSRYLADAINFITLEGSTLLPNVDIDAFQDIVSTYGDLPQSELAILADRQEGDIQVALIGLLYDNEVDAQLAVDEVTARISTYSDYLRSEMTEPILGRVEGAVLNDGYVYESPNTGLYVAVVSVNYPLPEARYDFGDADIPILVFRQWVRGFYTRGFYPLWQVTLPEE